MKIDIEFKTLIIVLPTICITRLCKYKKGFIHPQADYNKLQDSNARLIKQDEECRDNLDKSTIRITDLQEQIDAEKQNEKTLQSALDKCLSSATQGNVNISKLVDEINASNRYIQELIASKNKSDSLNMVLTNNLTRSLSHDEMQDVDVKVLKGGSIFPFR